MKSSDGATRRRFRRRPPDELRRGFTSASVPTLWRPSIAAPSSESTEYASRPERLFLQCVNLQPHGGAPDPRRGECVGWAAPEPRMPWDRKARRPHPAIAPRLGGGSSRSSSCSRAAREVIETHRQRLGRLPASEHTSSPPARLRGGSGVPADHCQRASCSTAYRISAHLSASHRPMFRPHRHSGHPRARAVPCDRAGRRRATPRAVLSPLRAPTNRQGRRVSSRLACYPPSGRWTCRAATTSCSRRPMSSPR